MNLRSWVHGVCDSIMVTRPVVLIPVWGFCALGFRRASAGSGWEIAIDPAGRSLLTYADVLIFSLAVAAVYVMNQIADIEVDKKNGGMPLIAQGVVSVRSAIVIALLCGGVPLTYFLLRRNLPMISGVMLTVVLGYIYSFKPFRLSGRPFADFISNGAGYGLIAFGVGWTLGNRTPFSSCFLIDALPYFLLMCAGSISSTLPDYEADKSDRKRTTAVVCGIGRAHAIASILLAGAIVAGWYRRDLLALICGLASLPVYTLFFWKRTRLVMESTYKIGGAFCMVASFFILPLFIPLSLVVFSCTWLYFRIRHGTSYPSLVPVRTS